MHSETVKSTHTSTKSQGGVVYRISCQNPGCAHSFDLRITPETASMLSGTIACPRCHRHGGMLKPQGRIGDKLFAAKLIYRMTGVAPRPDDDDLYAETMDSRY